MSGLEPLAVPLLIGGATLQAGGSIMAGREQARAADYERQQLDIQAQNTRIAAMQAETHRRDELTASLETIQVMRGGRGVGADSPTGMAILDSVTADTERDIVTERLGYLSKADQSTTGAQMAARRGKTSLLAGYLGAGEAVFSAAYKGATLGKYPVGARTRMG